MTRVRRTGLVILLCAGLSALHARSLSADENSLALLDTPGHVLIIRHALAPGTGDPDHFVLDDCTTQRNLSDEGRAQARQLGERLRDAGIGPARVYSSHWCRCLDTARELDLGPVMPLPVLDSLFGKGGEEVTARTRELRRFLSGLAPGDPVILVTHQANIRGLVDRPTASGRGVVLRVDAPDRIRVVHSVQ
jgi:broad specificity phosphatase PhoE